MVIPQQYIDLILSSSVTLLGIVLSWWLEYTYGKYKGKYKARKNKKDMMKSKLIQTILEQQLVELSAQRAFLFQRHNGGHYGTGKSMDKISTTHEAIEEGVSAEFHNFQNLPMSLWSTFLDNVIRNKAIYPSVDEIDDILTKAFFTQRGTRSAIVLAINKGDIFIGMVGFEWTHKIKNLEIYKESESVGNILGETLSKLL